MLPNYRCPCEKLRGEALEYFEHGRPKKALALYDKILLIHPDDEKALSNKASCLIELGNREEAKKCLDLAIKYNPAYAFAWNNRGMLLAGEGLYLDALECFNKAVMLDEGFMQAIQNKAKALFDLERYAEAVESYRKVLSLDHSIAYVWFKIGLSLIRIGGQKNTSHGVDCLKTAIKLDPGHDEAQELLTALGH